MKPYQRYLLLSVVGFFALIGMAFTAVFIGMQFGLFNVRGSIAERDKSFGKVATSTAPCIDTTRATCDWTATPEWAVIVSGLGKDKTVIARASAATGVSQRMIVAALIPEQIRFFTSDREVFKRYFEPLKILGSLTKFSLGVSGIKEDTANKIEEYAASTTSPFYPGAGMAEIIAYPATSTEHATDLYNRLADTKNHYYAYVYTALYIKEIEAQWKAAGYDISGDPAVVATLFNIGFAKSQPHANPDAGGAPITTGGITYTYGQLGGDFYDSDALAALFPRN